MADLARVIPAQIACACASSALIIRVAIGPGSAGFADANKHQSRPSAELHDRLVRIRELAIPYGLGEPTFRPCR